MQELSNSNDTRGMISMIKIVTSKETDKVKNLPKEVKSDIEETLKLLDCMYGIERSEKDLGGYVVALEKDKDIQKLKNEAYLDIYNDYPEFMNRLTDEWIKLVFLMNSDFSIVVYGTKEQIQLNKVKL